MTTVGHIPPPPPAAPPAGSPWPLCAWQALASTAAPGMDGGPACTCSAYYMGDEEALGELIAL